MRGNFDMSTNPKPKDAPEPSEMFSIDFENGFDGVPGVTQLLNPKMMQEKAAAMKKAKESGGGTPPIRSLAPTPAPLPIPTPIKENEISIDLGGNHDDMQIVAQGSSPTPAASQTPVAPSQQAPANGNSLAALGVQFELQFEMERGVYRYRKMKGHARANLALWQEKFYFQMKIDLKTLEVQGSFQEFAKATHPFHEDAFGLTDSSHVQIVRLEGDTQKLFVLVSEKSLSTSEQKVRDLLAGKSAGGGSASGNDENSFKIELAS
jgi:hypothetical protein